MMRLRRIAACSLVLAIASTAPVYVASPREALVVSPAWLAAHLSDANLVVLQVGPEFVTRHIPGARETSLDAFVAPPGDAGTLTLELPTPDRLRQHLRALGISDASRIVLAASTGRLMTTATRILVTLQYAGLGDRASVLDGGVDAWVREGHPLTAAVSPVPTGALSPLRTHPIVVDAAYVLAHLGAPGVAVVDARAAVYFDGAQTGGSRTSPQRAGHIAGATNIPYTDLLDDQGALRSAGELTTIFTQAGVKPGDAVIAYCHIGQQATTVILAAETLGHAVELYDGSFEDWSRHPNYPVTTVKKDRD